MPSGGRRRESTEADSSPETMQNQFWRGAMAFVLELWRFLRVRKKFWLIPVILMMAVFGGLVVLSKGSAIAPFIYTLF